MEAIRRVLVVEDDPSVAAVMGVFLRGLGYDVRLGATVAEAWTLVHDHRPSLVIADEQLPDGLGSDLLRALAAEHPEVARLLLTATPAPDVSLLPRGTLVRHKPWDTAEAESTLRGLLGVQPGR